MAWYEKLEGTNSDGLQRYRVRWHELQPDGTKKKPQKTVYGVDERNDVLADKNLLEKRQKKLGTGGIIFDDYAVKWLEYAASPTGRRQLEKSSWDRYADEIEKEILPVLTGRPLVDITRQELQELVAERPGADETKAKTINVLQAMWRDAPLVGFENVDASVVDHLVRPKTTGTVKRAPRMDMKLVRRLFAAADEVWEPDGEWFFSDCLKLLAFGGQRWSMTAGFWTTDWTPGEEVMRVERQRRRDGTIVEQETSGSTKAWSEGVPVDEELAEVLERMLRIDRDGHQWLLCSRTREPASYQHFARKFREAREAAGVTYKMHDLRHVGTSRWIKAGASQLMVMKAGGWKSLDVVAKVYAHLWPQDLQQLARMLNNLSDEELSS